MQRKPVASVSAPSGFAETGRSMKSTGLPVDEIRPRAYESAAFAAHELPPEAVRKRHVVAAYSASTIVKAEPRKLGFVAG